ncbi:hypothetical protein F5B22DRAFT_644014 [Xylaria bambusicola]|uniref:uncharacterized protein n=1 Tax=Xylaria bambusicola TaxID=326684 RepID=UPI0020076704|nr:uncharacterized protein F5B22DRAFT_644014 [Xylaria bambusicola]KAI0521288.1 hypothetical protein F5B22DRAFT_644014 [Xylaria bambusicola]
MPSMAGTTTLGLGLWEAFAAPAATFVEDWFALQYLLPLISFVCVGLEGWCFFDLMRKTLGARSAARAVADARDASSLDYDVVKDFPRGGFEPSNNQLCVHGLLGIKLHARHSACPSNPVVKGQGAKGLTMPCGCLVISKGRPQTQRRRRQEMSYIAI